MARLIRMLLLAGCGMIVLGNLSATTYYVDSVGGSDSNNGKSKTAAWAHAPGMKSCTSICSSDTPAAGDSVILKGGDSWTTSSLPWTLSASGASGNPIYYGVDTTWYTGTNSGKVNTNGKAVTWVSGNAFQMNGSWIGGTITINGTAYIIESIQNPYVIYLTVSAGTQSGVSFTNSLFTRPIINGQGLKNALVNMTGGYMTFDSIELTGQMAIDNSSNASLNVTTSSGNFLAENLDIHNWNRCTGGGTPTSYCTSEVTDNSGSGGGTYVSIYSGMNPNNVILMQSNVGNPENGGNIGACGRGWPQVISNYLHDCTQGNLHGGGVTHDNIFNNVGATFDGSTHGNVTYLDCFDGMCGKGLSSFTAYIYNNWIINTTGAASATLIYPNPGTSGVSGGGTVTYYIFNNVETNAGGSANGQIGDEIDPYGAPSGITINVHDWNNTYELSSDLSCVNVVARSGTTLPKVVDVQNLHCIESSAPSGSKLFDASQTTNPNLVDPLGEAISTANSQGYAAPFWQPQSSTAPTAGTGSNLSSNCSGTLAALCKSTTLGGYLKGEPRPSGTPWNIGAFRYQAGPLPATGFNGVVQVQ